MTTSRCKKTPIFVESAQADEYLCSICLDVMHQPVQVGCSSGHMYCEQCIKDCISASPSASVYVTCPLCSQSFHRHSIVPIPYIQRKINDLAVQCPNKPHHRDNNTNNSNNHNLSNDNPNVLQQQCLVDKLLAAANGSNAVSSNSHSTQNTKAALSNSNSNTNNTETKESSECVDDSDGNQDDEDSKKQDIDVQLPVQDDHELENEDIDQQQKDDAAPQAIRRSQRLQNKVHHQQQQENQENRNSNTRLCGQKRPRSAIANDDTSNTENSKNMQNDEDEENEDDDLIILNSNIPLKKLKLDTSFLSISKMNTSSPSLAKCTWTGRYGDFAQHLAECEYQKINCKFSNVGCTELIERRLITSHVAQCAYAPIKCPLCNHTRISKGYLEKHVLNDCIMTDVECTLCGLVVKRKDLKSHCKNDCAERWLECEYKRFGCSDVKKKDLEKHNQENMELHLKLVAKSHRKLEGQVSDLNSRLAQMERRYGFNRNVTGMPPLTYNSMPPLVASIPPNFRRAPFLPDGPGSMWT